MARWEGKRGNFRCAVARYAEARSDAEMAVQADPSYVKGHYRLALCRKD